jgi:hypothetical protein
LLKNVSAAEAEFRALLAIDPDHETARSELADLAHTRRS